MPMTPNRKPSIVSDRRQSIMGAERVIEQARDQDETPRIKSTGIHVDPDVAFMDQQKHEAGQARRPRGRPKKVHIPGRQGFQISDPEPTLSHAPLPIEKAPPLPPRQATGEWNRYPIARMQDGEFFFIPKGGKREMSQVRALAHRLKKVVKIRGKYTHNGVIGVGVWKV